VPSDQEPYYLHIWQGVTDVWQLKRGDLVRVANVDDVFSVRTKEEHETTRWRLRPLEGSEIRDEVGPNVFYDAAVRFMAENGMLRKKLRADIRMFDVWANEHRAYSYRGNDTWVDLIEPSPSAVTSPRTEQLPDDLWLVWRRSKEIDDES
jgi:hypothetical protein